MNNYLDTKDKPGIMNIQDENNDFEDNEYAEEEQTYGIIVGILFLVLATYGLIHNQVPFLSRRGVRLSFHGWSAWLMYSAYFILLIASTLSFYNFMNRKYRAWAYPKEKYLRIKTITKFLFILVGLLMATCLLLKWMHWVD